MFVDGCLWHGCPEHYRIPITHEDYWFEKIGRNVARAHTRQHANGSLAARFGDKKDWVDGGVCGGQPAVELFA